MKMYFLSMMVILSFGFTALASEQIQSNFENQYSIECKMDLSGMDGKATDEQISEVAQAGAGAPIHFDLGNYVLDAYALYSGSPFDSGEPVMEVSLWAKAKGPVAGQVNFAGLSGFKDIQIGQSRTVYSRNFLDISYKGKAYSRVDYSCAITRKY